MDSKNYSNKSLGQKGEAIVKKILLNKGFEIIDSNVQIGNIGEIDIIAKKDNIYRFVEVKTIACRSQGEVEDLPFYNINSKKKRTMARLAALWIAKREYTELYQLDAAALIYIASEDKWMYKFIENISW